MTKKITQPDERDTITLRAYRLVALWAVGILLLYAIGGYFGIRQLQRYKAETEKLRQGMIGAPMYVYQQNRRVRRQGVLLVR
jgi:hypothetical protein